MKFEITEKGVYDAKGQPAPVGTEITVKQRAPLNDPVALRVLGGTLTLRNNEADYIEIEVAE